MLLNVLYLIASAVRLDVYSLKIFNPHPFAISLSVIYDRICRCSVTEIGYISAVENMEEDHKTSTNQALK
jgi:hypothetical protein